MKIVRCCWRTDRTCPHPPLCRYGYDCVAKPKGRTMRETEAGRVTDATLLALETRRDGLYADLERRYGAILTTAGANGDVLAIEDEWIGLLHEYERVCRELQEGI